MKPLILLPPAVALLVVASWVSAERRQSATLEAASTALRKSISARESTLAEGGPGAAPGQPEKSAGAEEPIDWKATGALVAEMRQGGMTDIRAMMRLQKLLLEMSTAELAAALDEIATLGFPSDVQQMLEGMLFEPLVQKDPELALDRFIGRVFDDSSSMAWQLSAALKNWASKDATAASAWFDKAIAAGKFDSKSLDGKSQPRIQFESKLISVLVSKDPAAAGRRIGNLHPENRNEILSDSFERSDPTSHAAYAEFVRTHAGNEKEGASILGQQAAHFDTRNGFGEIDEFLTRISATPAERAESARLGGANQVSRLAREREITAADLEPMREWAATQSPDDVGAATGYALAQAINQGAKNSFAHSAGIAVQFHESSGDDAVLDTFLRTNANAWQHKEQALAIVEKIEDATIREKLLKDLTP